MAWNNNPDYESGDQAYPTSGNQAYPASSEKNKFKGRGHKVALGFLIVGILGIIAVGIWIGVDLKNRTETPEKLPSEGTPKPNPKCPQTDSGLAPWAPGMDNTKDVSIDGVKYLLTSSATLNSITITNGGKLVIQDQGPNSPALTLRLRHMWIKDDGEFWVGAEGCPYLGRLDIVLVGREDETGEPGLSGFGRKVIGVDSGGTIEMHGAPKLSWTRLTSTLSPEQGGSQIITLADDVTSWQSGDPDIVVASSDFDYEHTEKFSTEKCDSCTKFQIKIKDAPKYTHFGEFADGVDMRAEVGLLSRNVRIRGEVETDCYGFGNLCTYFDRDLFGGQTQVLFGFKAAHFADLELVDMGQQTLGNYPIHFHVTGDSHGAYVRRLAIHHTSSRCVTLHASVGVMVEDVVGYDSLGHCFFLEDGNEQNNTLRHNLGLVTRAGSMLPPDRNDKMCTELTDAVHPGYVPQNEDCGGIATFWITHPNNTIEDNVAAGSERHGFFFAYHRVPTGPSTGTLDAYHSERSPLKSFKNNRAHSNHEFALSIDRGVKVIGANPQAREEFLSLTDNVRYAPHENQDLSKPRVPAIIDSFTAYKNNIGATLRGGDIIVQDSSFVDNILGLMFLSENTLPYDIGSHQEVIRTKFTGRSPNLRDAEKPQFSRMQRGVLIRDGPILISDCTFVNYSKDDIRTMAVSALGFSPNPGQYSSRSSIKGATFDSKSLRLQFVPAVPTAGGSDLTQVLFDADGTLTGNAEAYVVRGNMSSLLAEGCTEKADWGAAVCADKDFGQVYVTQNGTTANTLNIKSTDTADVLSMSGVSDGDVDTPTTLTYTTLLANGTDYTLYWDQVAPELITIRPHNFKTGAIVDLALCYPANTTFTVTFDLYDQLTDTVTSSEVMTTGASRDEVLADGTKMTYFWQNDSGLLYVRLAQTRPLSGYNYCSDAGCEGISVHAEITNMEATTCESGSG